MALSLAPSGDVLAQGAPDRAPLPRVIDRTTKTGPVPSGPVRIAVPGAFAPTRAPRPTPRGATTETVAGPGAAPVLDPSLGVPFPPMRPVLSGSTLIGIFALSTGRTALLMFPGGSVKRVAVGDTVNGWRVSSISKDTLRMTRGGRSRTFALVGN